jgi:bifunctional non-homologous end joining protein LigD
MLVFDIRLTRGAAGAGGIAAHRRLLVTLRIDPCIPSLAHKPPSGPDWVHEVKHDGYRLIVRRDGEAVRLFTRRGYDWTGRYPAIASAAAKIRAQSFTLDGEAVVCGEDGVAIFDALHRHGTMRAAIPQAFDLLELNDEDLRPVMLGKRKARLARLLARAPPGIEAPRYSGTLARWAWRGSCRSAWQRPIDPACRGIGLRSRIPTARR